MTNWNMTDNIEDFPSGGWDNFDGYIEVARYEVGEYGTQLYVMVRPEDYEFEAREEEIPLEGQEFEGQPRDWFSLGGGVGKYTIDEDGMKITSGSKPNKNTAFVKFTTRLLQVMGRSTMTNDLTPFNEGEPLTLHWKREMETYNYRDDLTGQRKEGQREKLFPVGKAVGHSLFEADGEPADNPVGRARGRRASRASGGAESAESSGSSSGGRRRGGRRASGGASSGNASGSTRTARRGRRSSQQEDTSPPDGEEEDAGQQEGTTDASEDPIQVLKMIVDTTGDEGVIRRSIGQLAREYIGEYGGDVIKRAVSKANIDKAIEDGVIEAEDNRLYPAQAD